MARKKYVGPAESVYVAAAGEPLGYVKHGEVLEVPDDLAALVTWPESLWEDVTEEAKPKRARSG